MKIIQSMILIASLFGSSRVLAQGQEGHGGSVIACFQNEVIAKQFRKELWENEFPDEATSRGHRIGNSSRPIPSYVLGRTDVVGKYIRQMIDVQLYDLWLARHEDGIQNNPLLDPATLEPASRNFTGILNNRMDRIRATHIDFYEGLLSAKNLLESAPWINSPTAVVSDVGAIINIPSNCAIVQLASQRKVGANISDVYYDKRLFNKLRSDLDRAGIFIHEFVYKVMIQSKKGFNAVATQRIVRTVFKASYGPAITKDFNDLLVEVGAILPNNLKQAYGFSYTDNMTWGYHDGAYSMNDWDNGYIHRIAGASIVTKRIQSPFLSNKRSTYPGIAFYTYNTPREYANHQWNALQFDYDDRDQSIPLCGGLVDNTLPKHRTGQCNARLDANGDIVEYSLELTEDLNIDGYVFTAYDTVYLDSQRRLIGFVKSGKDEIAIPELAQFGVSCWKAVMGYTSSNSAKTILSCSSSKPIRIGAIILTGTIGFFPGNVNIDGSKISGEVQIPRTFEGSFSTFSPEHYVEYAPMLDQVVFTTDGTNQVVSFVNIIENSYGRLHMTNDSFCTGKITIHPNGMIHTCEHPDYVKTKYKELNAHYANRGTPAEFYDNGIAKSYRLVAYNSSSATQTLRVNRQKIPLGSLIEFNEQGKITGVISSRQMSGDDASLNQKDPVTE
ncbi:MAG: hypothetical protein JST80_03665 [Bdellovibrionales bacterium]|nr:hypothetical protein [Bdellovibrionales bacterium]